MMKPQQVWVNHMTIGDFNPPHIHHGDITFVLFVDVIRSNTKNIKYSGYKKNLIIKNCIFRTFSSLQGLLIGCFLLNHLIQEQI